MSTDAVDVRRDRNFFIFNAVISVAALSLLAWLLLLRGGTKDTGVDLRFMPAVNAGLNATSAVLLFLGWLSVKRGNHGRHQYLMMSALITSALFLICYLAYHFIHGDTKFGGTGAIRVFYLCLLASHVLLSMGIVPRAPTALWFG